MNTQVNQRKECECDICGDIKLCSLQNNGRMWLCNDCIQKEKIALENTTIIEQPNSEAERLARYAANPFGNKPKGLPEGAMASININEILQNGENQSIRIKTDIFNAKTASIVEIKKAIDENPDITNKPYALAEALTQRFREVKTAVFEVNEKLIELGNEQRAIQVYMNVLANQLKTEEREKLKLQDINYKPAPAKVAKVKTIKTPAAGKTKLDKVALRKAAAALGISEFTLATVAATKNNDLEAAVAAIKATIQKS